MTKRNIIVVGASAGGIEALCELIKHLPGPASIRVRGFFMFGGVGVAGARHRPYALRQRARSSPGSRTQRIRTPLSVRPSAPG